MSAVSQISSSAEALRAKARRFVIGPVLGVLFMNLMIGIATTLDLRADLIERKQEAERLARNSAQTLEVGLSGVIGQIDLTLQAVRDELERDTVAVAGHEQDLATLLTRHDARLPEALGLRLVDRDGLIRLPLRDKDQAPPDIRARQDFIRLSHAAPTDLVISDPMWSPVVPKWIITVGRRLSAPDGGFAGEIHAAIPLDYFDKLFASQPLGSHGIVSMLNSEGILIARYSAQDGSRGTPANARKSPQLTELLAKKATHATYEVKSPVDGVRRIIAFQKIGEYPLYLVVGIAKKDYFTDWQHHTAITITFYAIFFVVTVTAAWLLQRSWRQRLHYMDHLYFARRDAEVARQHANLILTSVGEGICGVDTLGRITFVNPATQAILGWTHQHLGHDLHQLAHHHRADGTVLAELECPVHQTLADGQQRRVVSDTYWRADGTPVSVEVTTTAIRQNDAIVGAVNVFRDVTEREQAETRIRRLNRLYEAVSASNHAVISAHNEDALLALVCRSCTDFGLKLAWVGMLDGGRIIPRCHAGEGGSYLNGLEIVIDGESPMGKGPTGTAVRTGSSSIVGDFLNDPRTAAWHERGTRYGWRSSAAFPLFRDGSPVGALTLYADTPHFFEPEETRLLDELAGDISFALDRFAQDREREALGQALQASRLQIIRSLGRAGDYRDNETGAHVMRMSHYCQILSDAAGHPQEFGEMLLQASPMHDVGKIGIPDAILLKPGKLDPDEYTVMKTHAQIGAAILTGADDPLLAMARTVALTHHEKWDGSGYPIGLRGEEIPLEGRIAAICDVFDALTSARPYKQPWPLEEALEFLQAEAGRHFDPALVEHFVTILPDILAVRNRFLDHEDCATGR